MKWYLAFQIFSWITVWLLLFRGLGLSFPYLSCSFGLRHWFKFGVPVVSSPPSFDSGTEVSMVEGMLTLLITLLSTRLHLGNVTLLCRNQPLYSQFCISCKMHWISDTSDKVNILLLSYRPYRSRNLAEGNDCSALYGWQNSQSVGWSDILLKKCFTRWT